MGEREKEKGGTSKQSQSFFPEITTEFRLSPFALLLSPFPFPPTPYSPLPTPPPP